MHRSVPNRPLAYGAAAGAVALAAVVRRLLDDWLGDQSAYATFYLAVSLVSWYAGLGPSLAAVVLGAVAVPWAVARPFAFAAQGSTDVLDLAVYLAVGSMIAVLNHSLRSARRGAEDAVRAARAEVRARQEAEAALRRRAEEVEALMEVMPVGVWIAHDAACRNITGNRAGRALLRRPEGANLSKSVPAPEGAAAYRVFHAGRELAPEELPMQVAAARGAEVRDFEEELLFEDGTVRRLFGHAVPLFDDRGAARGCMAAFMDITELKRLESELRDKVGRLAEADRLKDEFLATLAHELRNPLAPLRNALHILESGGGDPDVVRRMRGVMARQVDQLVRLVDDLLDVSRITRGKIVLRRERLEVAEVVALALETSRPLIEEGRHELSVSLPPAPVLVEGDPTRLGQVLSNLLNNAAKYTPEGGRITLTVSAGGRDVAPGEVAIAVADNGLGIPPELLTHVFDMFAQVGHHHERSRGGLGIGLTVVRSLAEMHGGLVEARSEGPGRGSTFVVRLPLAVAAPAPALS